MKVTSYPPVGVPVAFQKRSDSSALDRFFPGTHQAWIDSGTSALALALQNIWQESGHDKTEVVIPAYGCPDLVAAVRFAGFRARPIDLAFERSGYDMYALGEALGPQTAAIIAVNFLGIPENIESIIALAKPLQIAVIEDNAQWFPALPAQYSIRGDYATFSFGRGKAVNLLGGGLALSRRPWRVEPSPDGFSALSEIRWQAKGQVINLLSRPAFYRWLELLPFLGLGKTEYHELVDLTVFPDYKKPYLAENLRRYAGYSRDVEQIFRASLIGNRLHDHLASHSQRLLRFPLLFSSKQKRDQAHARLQAAGLGSSCFYAQPLSQISSIPEDALIPAANSNAQAFAQRLLTLPTHPRVQPVDALRMCDLVNDLLN